MPYCKICCRYWIDGSTCLSLRKAKIIERQPPWTAFWAFFRFANASKLSASLTHWPAPGYGWGLRPRSRYRLALRAGHISYPCPSLEKFLWAPMTVHRARLVLRWVTVRGYAVLVCNHSHAGQYSPPDGRPVVAVLCGREGNRRSGVALAMPYSLWYIHLRAQWPIGRYTLSGAYCDSSANTDRDHGCHFGPPWTRAIEIVRRYCKVCHIV